VRLGVVSPKLIQVYLDGGLMFEGIMVSKDGDGYFEDGALLDRLTLAELLVPRCGRLYALFHERDVTQGQREVSN
jgi:hypothetical protein